MTRLDDSGSRGYLEDDVLRRSPRSADAATILAIFVALQFVLPAKLIVSHIPLSMSAASLVALGLGLLWFATQMTTTLGAAKGRSPVRTMMFAYACALLASYTRAACGYLPSDERSIGDHAMVTTFALIFVGLAVCDGVRDRERLDFLLRVTVVCASAIAVVAIVQYLFGYDLVPHLRPPGMQFNSSDTAILNRDGRRVAGTTAHPIEFGVLCAMMLPLAVHVALHAVRAGRLPGRWWIPVGLLACGLMFSVSRSAIVAMAFVSLVLAIGWSSQRRRWMAAVAIGFLITMKIISPGLLGTIFNLFKNAGNDPSVSYRTHDYDTAKTLIAQSPWLGRGIGTWYAPKHEIFDNQYLLELVGSGLIGLTALLGIFVAAVYAATRVQFLLRGRTDDGIAARDRDLALSLAASLVVVFPSFATFDFSAFVTVSSLAFLLAGVSGALLRIVKAEAIEAPGRSGAAG